MVWRIARQLAILIIFYHICAYPLSLGIENISDTILRLLGVNSGIPLRVGLITNQTGCDQRGNRSVDVLLKKGVRVTYLLAPEHGFDGKVGAGKSVSDSVDRKTEIPIVSMYGRGGTHATSGKCIDPVIIKQLDALCYDLQDVGMRHYTYISTLFRALEAAAEYNKHLLVFDRPNLLGSYMEGPVISDPLLYSFISIAPIPLRHGMTVGELARYFNRHVLKKPAQLTVIPMKDYVRSRSSIPLFKPLSPNLQSLQSCQGYSFLGVLGEISPFDIGVGTRYAFQVILLPHSIKFSEHQWGNLAELFRKHGLKTVRYATNKSRGLRFEHIDMKNTASFRLLIDVVNFFKCAGVALAFSPLFDKATGTHLVRELLTDNGTCADLERFVNEGLVNFFNQAKDSFLYKPFPAITFMHAF